MEEGDAVADPLEHQFPLQRGERVREQQLGEVRRPALQHERELGVLLVHVEERHHELRAQLPEILELALEVRRPTVELHRHLLPALDVFGHLHHRTAAEVRAAVQGVSRAEVLSSSAAAHGRRRVVAASPVAAAAAVPACRADGGLDAAAVGGGLELLELNLVDRRGSRRAPTAATPMSFRSPSLSWADSRRRPPPQEGGVLVEFNSCSIATSAAAFPPIRLCASAAPPRRSPRPRGRRLGRRRRRRRHRVFQRVGVAHAARHHRREPGV